MKNEKFRPPKIKGIYDMFCGQTEKKNTGGNAGRALRDQGSFYR